MTSPISTLRPYIVLGLILCAVTAAAFFSRGWRPAPVEAVFGPPPPPATHTAYAQALSKSALAQTAAAQIWRREARLAVESARLVELPYQETAVLRADAPVAHAWRFQLVTGQALAISLEQRENFTGALFAEVFRVMPAQGPDAAGADGLRLLESLVLRKDPNSVSEARGEADDAPSLEPRDESASDLGGDAGNDDVEGEPIVPTTIVHTVTEDTTLLLRVQGEMLAEGAFSMTARANPTLEFPVDGVPDTAAQSFFGAPRGGGARRHEGVDIFAGRGTPVVAVSNGRIRRVGESPLGGLHIWQRSARAGQSYYYAHLDAVLVSAGERVEAGQTIGLVGNSGNARTTPPHLHFGLYKWLSGAVDPWPYINRQPLPDAAAMPTSRWMRVASDTLNFRAAATTQSDVIKTLSRGQLVQVFGATGGATRPWFRIRLPGGERGYAYAGLLSNTSSRIADTVVGRPLAVRARAERDSAVLGVLEPGDRVSVVATDPAGSLVRWQPNADAEAQLAWISLDTS